MMKKWKVGKHYVKGFAELENGRGEVLEIFQLTEMNEKEVTLRNVETDEIITVDQDDRYGRYPLLDKSRIENIENAYDEHLRKKYVLEFALKMMNKEGLRENR